MYKIVYDAVDQSKYNNPSVPMVVSTGFCSSDNSTKPRLFVTIDAAENYLRKMVPAQFAKNAKVILTDNQDDQEMDMRKYSKYNKVDLQNEIAALKARLEKLKCSAV